MIQEAKKHVTSVDFEVLDAREINKINSQFERVFCGLFISY